jgi:pyruvate-formate lyase-activating enzyme
MTTFSLPVISNRLDGDSLSEPPPVDRSKPYKSCVWLEGGLAFNRRSLNACLIVHHDRGYPQLCEYNGGELDFDAILKARERIVSANQAGGHPDCRGCPHLVTRRWPRRKKPIRLIGIAQFTHCNIQCNYCYLQTDDPAKFAAGYTPYAVLPALRQLIHSDMLDRRSTIDWGGGEPTIYPEFDQALELLTRFGATTWVHTNGTRVPKPIRNGLSSVRLHILCSIDAGTRQTWQRIKNKDLLHIVWRNIEQYVRLGARVVLKYIVTEENCAEAELQAFVAAARASGARELVIDIDYNHPQPSPAIIQGLRDLKRLAILNGFHTTFGSTGANFTPEIDVAGQLDNAANGWPLLIRQRLAWARSRWRLAGRRLRGLC